jgi:D-sedoheptulose 7-phosphate isomerase
VTCTETIAFIRAYFQKLRVLFDTLDLESLANVMDLLETARRDGRQVFIIGNGGSASTASHWACDLNKGASLAGHRRLRVISLTDNMAHFSAIANDCGYEKVFTEQLRNILQSGDIVIGISASGNSPNLVDAFEYANEHGACTIAIVGFRGGKIATLADRVVHVKSDEYGPVEDMHLIFDHVITDWFRTVVLGGAQVPGGAGQQEARHGTKHQ